MPPHAYFVTSAVFHYLGPSFAVLLFARVGVLGVAWLRIAAAAAVFAIWRRPWLVLIRARGQQRLLLLALGAVLGLMNVVFYLAIDRLPLSTVGAIEFLGPVLLAAVGVRTWRNLAALLFAMGGVALLTEVRLVGEPLGFVFAFVNCAGFVLYVVLGHRIAGDGGAEGIDRLGASMLVALVVVSPVGFVEAARTFTQPLLLAAGIGVGICSSVVPYVCDQLAMARLPRSTFALLLALLPATATVIGIVVLRQVPTLTEVAGILLVIVGVAVHSDRTPQRPAAGGRGR
ncbi:DMT family transporter [Fodinicola feengrottensis]|uniref:DMT family transporter n=1 Tax=Fodinicola feengrottensis TaxID=435914 RepID=A0ABP4TXN2_9ACTN